MKDIKSAIKKIVSEILKEMTSTGSVAGYQTPFAFSRKGAGKNAATKGSEKLGYKPVKDIDETVEEEYEKLNEEASYDASKDVQSLKQAMASTESSLEQKFRQNLTQKLAGKNVQAQASKGYGQAEKMYNVRVDAVTLEDYYGKDDYKLILHGAESGRQEKDKQFFVNTAIPLKIMSNATQAGVSQPAVPTAVAPVAPVAPTTPLEKQIAN